MSLKRLFMRIWSGAEPLKVEAPAKPKRSLIVSREMAATACASGRLNPVVQPLFDPAKPAPGVVPAGSPDLAMDSMAALNWANEAGVGGDFGIEAFIGFPQLAELAQRPEFRRMAEILSMEMTRRWVKLKSRGEEDKSDKIKKIEGELSRLKAKECFQETALKDALFGRSHLFIDLGDEFDNAELATSIGNGSDAATIGKLNNRKIRRLKPVEAVWCYPSSYNTSNPIADDWYKPTAWFVMGRNIHESRLLTFVGREVPDLLKPAYAFAGVSLSQMALPYVENWLRTRQSVNDLLNSFSQFVLKTNLAEKLQIDNGADVLNRADLFNNHRDNKGLMIVDKDLEDFDNVSAPLGTVDALQAQAQEHMAAVSGIPIVKLLGIQPAGLNASSEGELEVFYTWINSLQEKVLSPNLQKILEFIQVSLFGEVDQDITFEWEPLEPMNEKELAEVEKMKAETGVILVNGNVISREEERTRLASDEGSSYHSLNVKQAPPLSERERAEIAVGVTGAIVSAVDLVPTPVLLKELKKSSETTGVWTEISEEDINDALAEPPTPEVDNVGAPGGGRLG